MISRAPKSGTTVGIGIIGIGFGQRVHVPAFRADGRCKLVGIAASTKERASAVASRLGIPKAFDDWRALVESPEVNVISSAVPPALQPAIVVAAAAAGKHVFCEKPISATLDGAREMAMAASRAGIVHSVDFFFPEIEAWRKAKAVLDAGTLGRLHRAAVSWRVATRASREKLDTWKSRAQMGGGALQGFGSHSLHYLEWLLGSVRQLTARLSPDAERDTGVDAILEMENGVVTTLSIATDAFPGSGHRVEIFGEKGTLALDNGSRDYAHGFELTVAGGNESANETVFRDGTPAPEDGRLIPAGRLVKAFVDAVLGQRDSDRPDLLDGLRVQTLIAAARSSHGSGGWKAPEVAAAETTGKVVRIRG